MYCRSGCKEQNHSSYAECLRAANVQQAATMNSTLQGYYDTTKTELSAYRTARANGIQPEGTTMTKIKAAEEASRVLGRAYNADSDPPASLVTNKATAKFLNASV